MTDTKATAKAIVVAMEETWANVKGTSIKDIPALFQILIRTARKVEEYAAQTGGLSAKEKRSVAIHAINELVDIPWVPESFEDNLIGLLIDKTLDLLNEQFGHGWFSKLLAPNVAPPEQPTLTTEVE